MLAERAGRRQRPNWTPRSSSHPRLPFGLLPDWSDRSVDSRCRTRANRVRALGCAQGACRGSSCHHRAAQRQRMSRSIHSVTFREFTVRLSHAPANRCRSAKSMKAAESQASRTAQRDRYRIVERAGEVPRPSWDRESNPNPNPSMIETARAMRRRST
jgi:hypothetical protein